MSALSDALGRLLRDSTCEVRGEAGAGARGGEMAGAAPWARAVGVLIPRAGSKGTNGEAIADAGLDDPEVIARASAGEVVALLAHVIGHESARRVAGGLIGLARWWTANEEEFDERSTDAIRAGLREVKGIGVATADAIALVALGRPVVPLDRATQRIMIRHGWLEAEASAEEFLLLGPRLGLGTESSAKGVWSALGGVARRHCKAGVPVCEGCVLREYLPAGGPVSVEG
jgi:endonuclease-3 related protein